MNLAFGMIFVDSGIIFVGDDVVLREGELQLEWFRQNHYFDVDIRCFAIAASVIDLPAFCDVTEIASSVEKVFTLPTILEDCYDFLLPFAMDYDVVVMLLLNFGGSQVMSPPDFVGFYAIEIDAKTLQLFLQIDVAPTTAGYFVASMLSVAESLVQSDTPHILSDVLCDASLETELWSVCKLLLVFVGASVMLLLRDVFQFQFNPVLLLVVDSTNTTLSFSRNDMTMCSKTGAADSDHWLFKRHVALLLHLSFAQVYEGFISFYEGEDKHVAVMFHRKSKVAAALLTNVDFALLLYGDVSFVGQAHVDDSGRLSTFIFGSLTRPPEARNVYFQFQAMDIHVH